MLDQLTLARDQAHIDTLATQIQPNVQHNDLPSEEHEQDQPGPRRTVSKVGPSFRIAGRADRNRARLTYAVRRGGPTAFTERSRPRSITVKPRARLLLSLTEHQQWS
jgi:hypothetical protein